MILVDASVLIDLMRSRDTANASTFSQFELAICGVTRAEILHGAISELDRLKLGAVLDRFTQINTTEDVWDHLGGNLFRLRKTGISLPFADALLATIAIDQDVELWSNDRHFAMISQVLPLRLYQPTP